MPKVKKTFQHIADSPKLFLFVAWSLFVFALLVFGLVGCMTEEKAIHHLLKKNALARVCADNFPVKDSIATRETISFDTTTTTEASIADLKPEDVTTNQATKSCVPVKQTTYITKTIRRDSIIYQRDRAHESVLSTEIQKQQAAVQNRDKTIAEQDKIIQKKESRIKTLLKYILWLLLAVLILFVILFRKQIGRLLLRLINPLQ